MTTVLKKEFKKLKSVTRECPAPGSFAKIHFAPSGRWLRNIFVKFLLISLSIFVIYVAGVPWLAYLAGWEIAYVWGIKNFVLAEIFKISILALSTEKLLKIRRFT